ncbi:dUTPase [Actinomycetes bacterium]|nr:dUTPase [Actinomycetes bacterium]
MATDYDTPRKTDEELHEESLEELKARRSDAQSGQVDIDEEEAAENLELPGADLSGEELAVRVVPKQTDEFTCSGCFLVQHHTQLARSDGAKSICKDCA